MFFRSIYRRLLVFSGFLFPGFLFVLFFVLFVVVGFVFFAVCGGEGAGFVFHVVNDLLHNAQLGQAFLALHGGVDAHGAADLGTVVFAEAFLELVDVVEGVAVDAQALVEPADAQVLFGEAVVGQGAEKFKEVAAGFAEGAEFFNGWEIGEVGVLHGGFNEVVAADELFAHEFFQGGGFCGGHEGGNGAVQGFVVVLFAVLAAEVVAEVHDGTVLLNDHGVGQGHKLEFAGVVDGFENGVDAAHVFQVVVQGEVELFGFLEGFAFAVRFGKLQQGVLAAQGDAQLAEGVAVVGIGEEGVARLDDALVLAFDEGGDADAEGDAEQFEVVHLLKVDAVDADGLFWLGRRQVEHFAAAFFEMDVEAGHGAHPVAEVGLMADDDDGFAVFVAGQGGAKGVEVAFFEEGHDFGRHFWHVAAEHFGGLQGADFWRCPHGHAVFDVEVACQGGIGVFKFFTAVDGQGAAKIAAVGGDVFCLAVAN